MTVVARAQAQARAHMQTHKPTYKCSWGRTFYRLCQNEIIWLGVQITNPVIKRSLQNFHQSLSLPRMDENTHFDFTSYSSFSASPLLLTVVICSFSLSNLKFHIFCLCASFVPICPCLKFSWPSYYRRIVWHILENVRALPFTDVRITRCWPRIHYLLLEPVFLSPFEWLCIFVNT